MDPRDRKILVSTAAGVSFATLAVAYLRRRRQWHLSQQSEEVVRTLASVRTLRALRQSADFVDDFIAQLALEGLVFFQHDAAAGTYPCARPAVKMSSTVGPMALVPMPFPAPLFEKAFKVAGGAQCRLLDAISCDPVWLKKTFGLLAQVDEFVSRCLTIAERTAANAAQKIRCHILRNHFMLDSRTGCLRQTQVVTSSASFSGSARHLSSIHRRLLAKYLPRVSHLRESCCGDEVLDKVLPRNDPSEGVAEALAEAHRLYCARYGSGRRLQPVVLFVAMSEEPNEADHRHVELALNRFGVQCVRRTMHQLVASSWRTPAADGPSRLMIECGAPGKSLVLEASVCYFMWLWATVPEGWSWREELARSVCIEVPTVGGYLAGTKLVQAACAAPHRLEELRGPSANGRAAHVPVLSEADRAELRSCYTEQYLLWDPVARACAQAAFVRALNQGPANHPSYIAKAGRNGLGGRKIIYEQSSIQMLLDDADIGRAYALPWILVEKVAAPPHPCLVVNTGDGPSDDTPAADLVELRQSVCDLGVFAVAVADGGSDQLRCRAVGHVVSSRNVEVDDSGAWSPTSYVMDTVFLCRGDWAHRDNSAFGAAPRGRAPDVNSVRR